MPGVARLAGLHLTANQWRPKTRQWPCQKRRHLVLNTKIGRDKNGAKQFFGKHPACHALGDNGAAGRTGYHNHLVTNCRADRECLGQILHPGVKAGVAHGVGGAAMACQSGKKYIGTKAGRQLVRHRPQFLFGCGKAMNIHN